MRSGTLRYIVEILTPAPRVDNYTAAARDWSVYATVRASIMSVSTTERAAFGGKTAEATHTVTCRYVAGVTNKMRLRLAGGRVFDISDIRLDPTMRRRMTIKATERVQ